MNGELQLTVTTSCGPMGGSATLSVNTLTVSDIATGAMGCIGEDGNQQLWVLEFLKRPIEQTFSQGTLTWKSGTDTLSLKNRLNPGSQAPLHLPGRQPAERKLLLGGPGIQRPRTSRRHPPNGPVLG